jgi:hypothetical protein
MLFSQLGMQIVICSVVDIALHEGIEPDRAYR